MKHVASLLAATALAETFTLGAHFGDSYERWWWTTLVWRIAVMIVTVSAAYIAWNCHRRWAIVVRPPFYAAPQTQPQTPTRASAPPAGQAGQFQQPVSRN